MDMSPVVSVSIVVGLAGAGAILLSAPEIARRGWLNRFLRWQDRQRQRAALRDVGLSREQAEREGGRHD